MARSYKTAVIGAGNIAALFDDPRDKDVLTHAHAYSLHPGFKLCGFADVDEEKAKTAAERWGGRSYASIADLVEQEHPEVISVCTPDGTHAEVVRQLEGKNILGGILEKPLAVGLVDASAIAASSLVKKGKFIVNYSRLFVPEFQKLKQDYRQGAYGRLIAATGYYGKGLLHNGSHVISLLSWLFGNIKVVKKFSSVNDFTNNDPSVSAVLRFSTGAEGVLHAIDSRLYTMFELDLVFEKARLRMIDSGHKLEIYGLEKSKRYIGYTMMNLQETITTSLGQSLSFAVENLYAWLEGSQPPLSTVQEALTAQKICQDIILSK
ncbi:MAG: Oxidoreductase domain protein [Parcubacteria group bacterium GW2011_GWC2_45_7]|nr:MAG: Oxidoreductase domain protein [Parcubacteria group bacterium GW2011_GWC2_45_7]